MTRGWSSSLNFADRIIAWQKQHGRHDLPWQRTNDAYRIWLSEIMLQQTQVATVIPYYERFVARFPDVTALAAAPIESVMQCWAGLGYYSRARNLHRCAQLIVSDHGGTVPAPASTRLAQLPGIGRSTAAAIAALAFGERAAILDGNVRRVLARHCGIEGFPGHPKIERQFWQRAESLLPVNEIEAVHAGHDGSGRDGLHAQPAEMRRMPGQATRVSRAATHTIEQSADTAAGQSSVRCERRRCSRCRMRAAQCCSSCARRRESGEDY